MHSAIYFINYNLKRLFTSPRSYITFLFIFVVMIIGLGKCNTYLAETGQMFQVVELYVFTHSSNSFLVCFTFGLLVMLGDAPFLDYGISFRLIRSSRFQWLVGQIFSCVIIVFIYLVVIELLLFVLFCRHITFQNEWSAPIILSAQYGNGMVINTEMAILFSLNIIQAGSPYVMFGLTFVFSFLLYTFFSMVLITCNIRFRTVVGYLFVVAFVSVKMILYYVFNSKYLRYISPCNLACLNEQSFTSVDISYSIMFLLVLCCCLGLLALHFTNCADLLER